MRKLTVTQRDVYWNGKAIELFPAQSEALRTLIAGQKVDMDASNAWRIRNALREAKVPIAIEKAYGYIGLNYHIPRYFLMDMDIAYV